MALTAAAIVSNALFLQNGHHPKPLFTTRSAELVDAAPAPPPVPTPRVRAERPAPVAAAPVVPDPAGAPPSKKVVAALQRELAENRFYAGAIDGVVGSRTKAAISSYQKQAGLPVTGEPSSALLAHIRTAAKQPAPKVRPDDPPDGPVVAAKPATAVPEERPVVVPVALKPADPPVVAEPDPAIAPLDQHLATPVAEVEPLPAPTVAEAAAPAEEAVADASSAEVPEAEAPVVAEAASTPDPAAVAHMRNRSIQHALNEIGYGPVPEDGVTGKDTADAIRRFELDNGLPITGLPEGRVIDRLVAIGALAPT